MKPTDIVIRPAAGWNLKFGEALEYVRQGGRASRVGWNCDQTWLEIFDDGLVKRNPDGSYRRWEPSDKDLLAQDWHIIPHQEPK